MVLKVPVTSKSHLPHLVGAVLSLMAAALMIAIMLAPAWVAQALPAFQGMGLNTLLAFALSGAGLLAQSRPRFMAGVGMLLAGLALATLWQFSTGQYPGAGPWQMLVNTMGGMGWPGRMSPGTALAFLATGLVFIALPRAHGGISLILIHGLLGGVFLIALIGLMGQAMGIAMFSPEFPIKALLSVPTAVGLMLLSIGLYLLASLSEGLGRYYQRYPDRRILSITIFLLLVLLLIGGLVSSAIVGRHALDVLQRTLADSLRANRLMFQQSVTHAEQTGHLAISLAASDRGRDWLAAYLAHPGTESISAVWRDEPGAGREMLYGTLALQPALAVALSANGGSRLIWRDAWLVEIRQGGLGIQVRIPELKNLLHYTASLGATADILIATARDHGLEFIYTRLHPEPFFHPSGLGPDGDPLPATLALRGRTGTIVAKDYRGKDVVAAFSPLFGGRLVMVQKVDAEELSDSLRHELWKIVLFLLLLATLGTLLLYRYVLPLARQLREVQTSLEGSLHKNELILQCAGEGIYGLDSQGCPTFINAAAEKLLGYRLEDIDQTSMHRLIHHRKRDGSPYPEEECPIFQTLRDGSQHHEENEVFWRKDGCPLEVEYVSAPILEAGQVTGAVVVFSDITQRRRHEATLGRWQHLFEHAEWGLFIGSADENSLELMNPAFARMHGYTMAELLGRPISDVFAPECHQQLFENIRITHEKGHLVWESWHIHKDGRRFPVQIDATAVKDENGAVQYRVVNVQDITERRRAEDTLRESEAHLARAQAQGNLGSWWLDVLNNTLEWSIENYRIFGIAPGTPLTYEAFLACIHPDDRAYVDQAWRACLSGEPYDIQHRIVVAGQVKWVRERAELEFAADGTLLLGAGTTQDITELKRHEDELLRSRQSLRELAAHHEKIREEERTRIAREIHDELGQYLTALRMDIAMLNIRFAQDRPDMAEFIAGMKQTVDTTIGVVRDIAAALRPGALDMGLVSAAEWLLTGCQERTGIHCHLEAPDENLGLDDERATAAFRILQESLTNIICYAQASEVEVQLRLEDDTLVMLVRDDGIGFDPSEVRNHKTFGLMGIRERALMFEGESRIDSEPGGGTTLRIRIPLAGKGV